MPIAHEMVAQQRSRMRDRWGSGEYGASRGGGARRHRGLDIVTRPGEDVFSPITGTIYRESVPYRDDPSYRGVVIRGSHEWVGYEIKIFYVEGFFSGEVTPGQVIGKAQNLRRRYRGITNHVHLEVRKNRQLLTPNELWSMSF